MDNTIHAKVKTAELALKLECLKIATSFAGSIQSVSDNYKILIALINLSE